MSPLAPPLRPPRPGDRKHRAAAGRAVVSLALSGFAATCTAEVDISKLPPPADGPVDFARDVRPILENACLRCHGPERPKSGYRLDNRADALKGGAIGTAIIPGDSSKSPLIHYVARLIEDLEMPPVGKGEPLTSEQVALLRAWVDQGAPYSADAETAPRLSLLTASPVVGWVGITGNERKFREHNWITDGFAGGLQEFTWRETLPDGTLFKADGRALGGNEDYRLRLSLERPGQGFVRAGFTQFRRWYDDAGGWYAPFTTSPFRLGEDLYTDTTRAWFDVGLDRPGWPRLQVGYEYQQRDGTKAITQWGPVSDFATGETKAIYPAAKSFDETVHLIKADLAHTLLGVRVEDSFQLEFYDRTSNRRVADAASASDSGPDVITRFQDAADHRRLANTFRLERLVREGVLLTGGYRYADLDGGAGFSMETFLPSDPALGPFVGDVATDIVLRQQSHVANGNAQLGPWANFTLTAGAQAEWLRQQGFGRATISGFASPFESSLDRQTVQELATLRYTGLPFTVVYAEARLEQQAIGQFEDRRIDDGFDDDRDFLRDTDATVDGFDARAGITISPWQRVALSAGYRYRERSVDYDHRADTDGSLTPGNGYPAFIRAHDFTGEEMEARLVFRANRWLKTTLKFQVVASESYTDTPSVIAQGTGDVFTGGRWQSGNYDAHVISFSATVAPWRRLVLTPLVSYAPSRLSTAGAEAVGLPEYAGDIVSVICGASFVLDSRTDLTASYGFSTADFARAASTDYLPLGIEYDRHALTAGLRRRFTDRVSGTLDYGFFAYSEPISGGAADYTAHGVFAGVSVRFK
ncbi:MAG: hypothetical protein IPM17_08465 [Verrucomicrobia bacterium]|nr:hypothetical protein [Verrucomicrobiota bacterium]